LLLLLCSTYRHVVADHDLQPAEDLEDAHAVRASAAHPPTIDRQIANRQKKTEGNNSVLMLP
jgi:hypothetical protein